MQKKMRERAGKKENILTGDHHCATRMNPISGASLIFFSQTCEKNLLKKKCI